MPPFSRKPTGQLFMSYRTHGDSHRDLGYGTPARGAVHIFFIAQAFLWHQRFPCPPRVTTWDVAGWYNLSLRSQRSSLYFSSAPFLVALQVREQSCLVTNQRREDKVERQRLRGRRKRREEGGKERRRGKGRQKQNLDCYCWRQSCLEVSDAWVDQFSFSLPVGFSVIHN